jgi:hypothetical protein
MLDEAPLEDVPAEKKPARTRKAPSYSFVKDLDLHPSGKPSFKEFFGEKAPPDQQTQFAVIVYYLTQVLELTNVGVNHLFSCLSEVNENVPTDIAQIARNTSKRKGWIDTADSTNLKLTTKGLNYVKLELPQPKA